MRWLGDRALRNLHDLVAQAEPVDVVDGRFELGQRIGEGGMGTVYAGVDRETGREVAATAQILIDFGNFADPE